MPDSSYVVKGRLCTADIFWCRVQNRKNQETNPVESNSSENINGANYDTIPCSSMEDPFYEEIKGKSDKPAQFQIVSCAAYACHTRYVRSILWRVNIIFKKTFM